MFGCNVASDPQLAGPKPLSGESLSKVLSHLDRAARPAAHCAGTDDFVRACTCGRARVAAARFAVPATGAPSAVAPHEMLQAPPLARTARSSASSAHCGGVLLATPSARRQACAGWLFVRMNRGPGVSKRADVPAGYVEGFGRHALTPFGPARTTQNTHADLSSVR